MAPVTTCHRSADTSSVLSYRGSAYQTAGSCSHMCREKTDQSNEIHLFNSTIIMALSIAERHNLNTLFGRKGKSVWLVCACVMCRCSTAWLPKQHNIHVTPSSHYCNRHIFRVRVRTVKGRRQAAF